MTDTELLSCFQREADGRWTCIKPVRLDGPDRHVAVAPGCSFSLGTMFMGMDIARTLDAAAMRLPH